MQYILVNIQTLATAHGMFLNESHEGLDMLKIKRHHLAPM